MSDRDLRQAYADASVFVLPAIVDTRGDTEGLGVVLLEAMSYRVPVVASDLGGITDIVTAEETGLLVPPADAAALTAALERLAGDATLAERLGDAGYRVVQERFSWPAILGSGRRATPTQHEHELVLPAQRIRRQATSAGGPRMKRAGGAAAHRAPLHSVPAIRHDPDDLQSVSFEQVPPCGERQQMFVDVLLRGALMPEQSPSNEILIRDHDAQACAGRGDPQHLPQAPAHVEEMFERPEARHVVEPAGGKGERTRRRRPRPRNPDIRGARGAPLRSRGRLRTRCMPPRARCVEEKARPTTHVQQSGPGPCVQEVRNNG